MLNRRLRVVLPLFLILGLCAIIAANNRNAEKNKIAEHIFLGDTISSVLRRGTPLEDEAYPGNFRVLSYDWESPNIMYGMYGNFDDDSDGSELSGPERCHYYFQNDILVATKIHHNEAWLKMEINSHYNFVNELPDGGLLVALRSTRSDPNYLYYIIKEGQAVAQGQIAWPYTLTDPDLWIDYFGEELEWVEFYN